jgi:hypothetical protein
MNRARSPRPLNTGDPIQRPGDPIPQIKAALGRAATLLRSDSQSRLKFEIEADHRSPLLTEEEAIAYLRLDTIQIDDPAATLRRYRERGLLRGTQVSKRVFYLREELDQFLKRLTNENPR